jgi:hypothetical protein
LPSVSISGTLTYCSGASTTLDAGSFVSYLWSNGETTQTISATAGNYTVTVTDSNGCSNTSAQVAVSELAPPTVAISGTLSYCAGSNTTLTATAGLNTYLWSSGETTQSITATAGSYTVTGTDSNGCSNTSSSVTVTETALDNAAFAYSASSYEPTDADPTPTITGLTGGTFSGTTGLVINSTTGEIDLSASTVASHTITYDTTSSGSSVCPNTSTQTVDIALAGIANNYSMSFDGSNDYIDVGDSDSLSFTNGSNDLPFTFSSWVYFDSVSGARAILGKDNGTQREYALFSNSGKLKIFLKHLGGGTQCSRETNNVVFSTGQWYHVAASYDGSGGSTAADGITLYINGVVAASTATNNGSYSHMSNTTADFNIGRYSGAFAYFYGLIDELAVWNTALTSTQVSEIYNATGTNLTKDLTTVSGSNLKYWNRMGD